MKKPSAKKLKRLEESRIASEAAVQAGRTCDYQTNCGWEADAKGCCNLGCRNLTDKAFKAHMHRTWSPR